MCRATERRQRRIESGAQAAHTAVARAIRHANLPRPALFRCVDCRGPADRYDHRDYSFPLDVQPVCRSCNWRRGPALARKHLPAELLGTEGAPDAPAEAKA